MAGQSERYVGVRQWKALRHLCDVDDGLYVAAESVARAAYGDRWRTEGMAVVGALLENGLAERVEPSRKAPSGVPWPLIPDDLLRVTAEGESMRLRPSEKVKLYSADWSAARAWQHYLERYGKQAQTA